MNTVTWGLIISFLCVLLLEALFRHEMKRGSRIGERFRTHADFFVLKVAHALQNILRFLGRDFIRQTFHFVFHAFLLLILSLIRSWERGLRNMMRVNKTLARNAERENTTRSKLDEMALHKISSALSEEEKQAHREKTLNGV